MMEKKKNPQTFVDQSVGSSHVGAESVEGFKKEKWMQHRDFPGGHPSQYYSGPKALNFRVLMGSGVVALV